MAQENKWLEIAKKARDAYANKEIYKSFPPPMSTGLCARCARALWEAVNGRIYPYEHPSATAMQEGLKKRKIGFKRYHTAVAKGLVKPGTFFFYGGNRGYGHVVTCIDLIGDPAISLEFVKVIENTSAGKAGTHITTLDVVTKRHGDSSNITWVAYLEADGS